MNASDIPQIAAHLLDKHGLAQQGWTFRWDHARRRAGCCKYGSQVITVSRHYAALNAADRPDDIVDTILHEIAHALTPGDHHGAAWRAACLRVGARPKRCYDSATVTMPKGKLTATCGGCGCEFRRHKHIQLGTTIHCAKCGPERGRLTFTVSAPPPPIAATDTPPLPRKLRGTY